MKREYNIDPAQIRDALRNISSAVSMHYYTSTVDSWYTHAERQLLQAIANQSENVVLYPHDGQWDAEREAQERIARTPAIALYGDKDTGIRYYGAPDGYELATFLNVLNEVGSGLPVLRPETMAQLKQLTYPVHLEVVVLPT